MKTIRRFLFVLLLGALAPSPCLALWGVAPVDKPHAAELGLEIRAQAAGPNHLRVELEFKTEGAFKSFADNAMKDRSRVDLRVGDGDNPPLTVSLREDRSKPGRIIVSFVADRNQLEKLHLWVMCGEPLGGSIYTLRVKDFVEPKSER